jgi:hypothetical protein
MEACEGFTETRSELLREISEVKETLRLERSKNMDDDSRYRVEFQQ